MSLLDKANLPPDAAAVIARWNERMPRHKVRLMNPQRYRDLMGSISLYGVGRITAAIDHYAGRVWNRAKNAWTTFDRFIAAARLCREIEEAAEEAELARHAREKAMPPAPAVAAAIAGVGRLPTPRVAAPTPTRLAAAEWERLDGLARKELLDLAWRDLVRLTGRHDVPPARIKAHALRVLLPRRLAEAAADGQSGDGRSTR